MPSLPGMTILKLNEASLECTLAALGFFLVELLTFPLRMLQVLRNGLINLTAFLALNGLSGSDYTPGGGMYGATAQSPYLLGLGKRLRCVAMVLSLTSSSINIGIGDITGCANSTE
jgi:hypothetical protein